MATCTTCSEESMYTIELVRGTHGSERITIPRYYIPNQSVRSEGASPEIAFCPACMRKVEDGLRSTILYLLAENRKVSVTPVE